MTTPPTERFHITLDTRALDADDKKRDELIGAIREQAPKSALYKDPVVAQTVGALLKSYDDDKEAGQVAAASAKKAQFDALQHRSARSATHRLLVLLKSMVEHDSKSESDVTSMAFDIWKGPPPAPALEPPVQIDVVYGRKGYGKAKVSIPQVGKSRRRYAAQWTHTPEDEASWQTLTGTGRSRHLAGRSGEEVYVRFALVRGELQSAWSEPRQVLLP